MVGEGGGKVVGKVGGRWWGRWGEGEGKVGERWDGRSPNPFQRLRVQGFGGEADFDWFFPLNWCCVGGVGVGTGVLGTYTC